MPSTVPGHIEAALFARVRDFVHSPALPISWPNVPFNPPPGPHLRVTHIPNMNRRLFLGSNDPHQRLGILQIGVFAPFNQGTTAATEIAGEIEDHFPADLVMRSGPVVVRVERAPESAQPIADTAHWLVPVSIRYQAII